MCVPLGILPSHFAIAAGDILLARSEIAVSRGAVDCRDGLRVTVHDNGGTDPASVVANPRESVAGRLQL